MARRVAEMNLNNIINLKRIIFGMFILVGIVIFYLWMNERVSDRAAAVLFGFLAMVNVTTTFALERIRRRSE